MWRLTAKNGLMSTKRRWFVLIIWTISIWWNIFVFKALDIDVTRIYTADDALVKQMFYEEDSLR